ncbi:hypothetical protein NMG60_11016610 [Bertholletia excelsa]
MFSGLIPGLNSVNSLEAELSVRIPATLIKAVNLSKKFLSIEARIPAALIKAVNLSKQFLSIEAYSRTDDGILVRSLEFFRREWLEIGAQIEWRTLVLCCVYAGIVITVALIVLTSKKKGHDGKIGSDSSGDSPVPTHLLRDAILNANGTNEIISESDEIYAEELQVQEALLLSLLSAKTPGNSLSSFTPTDSIWTTEPSQGMCGICFEELPLWRMFSNQNCSHSFCRDCTSKHIKAKIQENVQTVLCPEVGCKAALDFDACRKFIPRDVLVGWDECLCKSLVSQSETMYCPFRDCSAMLQMDSGVTMGKTYCPACHRAICVECRVPWHSEFECNEFQRLTKERRGGDEALVRELAKKKGWRSCPNCKVRVEKTEGCAHMTCWCKFQFCYRCGSEWAPSHRC